jgi:hypothetical protein
VKLKLLLLLFLVQGSLLAQSKWEKTIDAPEVHSLSIELGFIQNLLVSTGNSDQYVIKTTSEGEYRDQVMLVSKEVDHWLEIYPQWAPSFIAPNDKLSAHKVRALNLELVVPKGKTIEIRGEQAVVSVLGEYKEVVLRLGSGRVNLEYSSEESDIRTDSADVFLTVPHGDIQASSSEGKVIGSIPLNTRFHYKLASEKGSIYLNKA